MKSQFEVTLVLHRSLEQGKSETNVRLNCVNILKTEWEISTPQPSNILMEQELI
jgi:hypothetical protein